MKINLEEAIPILEQTPRVLQSLLANLPEPWIRGHEGKDSWSPYDIVGHLIHGEKTDWIPRAKRILESGESEPFDPFDRFAQFDESRGKSLTQLLEDFEKLRKQSLRTLRDLKLKTEDLDRRGLHPDLGKVNLGQLLATWVVHDLGHLSQISRVMAKQYSKEVGPWEAYLPVLHDRESRAR